MRKKAAKSKRPRPKKVPVDPVKSRAIQFKELLIHFTKKRMTDSAGRVDAVMANQLERLEKELKALKGE